MPRHYRDEPGDARPGGGSPGRLRGARLALARVHGVSMSPTLDDGDVLLVRPDGRVQPGCLAVVVLPDRTLAVKRVTRWDEDESGWWVERDNPRAGVDSWTVGAIPARDVRAVVVARLWPPSRLG